MGVCPSQAELECRGDETSDGAQHQTSDDERCVNCVLRAVGSCVWETHCLSGSLMLAGGTISCD